MAFTQFNFTKDWTNPVDFPTYEESEAKVRADYQELHNQTRDYINNILIADIQQALEDIVVGELPDDSVTIAKVNFTTSEIDDESTNSTVPTTKTVYDFVVEYVAQHSPVGGGWVASPNEPESTDVLWIDTSGTTGGLKYYDVTTEEWVHCPVAYTETPNS